MRIDWYEMLLAVAIGFDLAWGYWYTLLGALVLVWVLWNRHHRKVIAK